VIDGFAKPHGLTIEPVVMPTAADRIPALNRGDLIIVDLPERRRRELQRRVLIRPGLTHRPHPQIQTLRRSRSWWARSAIRGRGGSGGRPARGDDLFADRREVFEALRQG
jgi:hypothetical protein